MNRIGTAILIGTLASTFAAGCGGSDADSAGPVPAAPAATSTPTGAGGEAPGDGAARQRAYRIWLTRGDGLFAAWRDAPREQGVGAAALGLLLDGPSAAELRSGVSSAIPSGTRLLGLDVGGGTATVDLTSEFESGGGSLSMTARLAQVVYTLTEFPTVRRVRFALDGSPVSVFSGEGIVLDHPVGRKDYDELLPPISVDSPPLLGRRVSSPLEVSGTANVFEANVTVRLLDRNGRELERRFTTATCGTGCRGDFSISLPYQSPTEQPGTLVLSDDDADGNGSPQFEVRIPVTLSQA